jgi:hypothetical protein
MILKEIHNHIINNHIRESLSIIPTSVDCYAVNIVSPSYNAPITIPPIVEHQIVDSNHSSLIQCAFCQEKKYIRGYNHNDTIFCADCVNQTSTIKESAYDAQISVLYHIGATHKRTYYARDFFILLLEINDESVIVRCSLRETINTLSYTSGTYTVCQNHRGGCDTCDTMRTDLYYNIEQKKICVGCARTVFVMRKYHLFQRFLLIGEFTDVIADIAHLFRAHLVYSQFNALY